MTPERVVGSRTEAVVVVPQAREPETDRRELGALVSACRVAMDFTSSDSIGFVDVGPPAARLDVPIDGPYVVFNIVPRHFSTPNCRGNPNIYTLLPTRGVRISFDREPRPETSVRAVALRRDSIELIPAAVQLLDLRRYTPRGFDEPHHRWARVTIRLEDLGPDVAGNFAPVRVSVLTDEGGTADEFEVPSDVLARVWLAALPSLAESLGPGTPIVAIPQPRDAVLRAAYEDYQSGDLSAAVGTATARIVMSEAPDAERYWAYAVAGVGFSALGRGDGARVAFQQVLAVEPCFTLDASAPPELRATVEALRDPMINCATTALRTVALRAALLPGFGRATKQFQAPRRGLVPLAITGLSFSAIATGLAARDTYDRYVAWQATPDVLQTTGGDGATKLYDEAESQRMLGKTLWMAAAGVYASQLVIGVLREWQFQRRLERVGGFGASIGPAEPARLSVVPVALSFGSGVALRFTW